MQNIIINFLYNVFVNPFTVFVRDSDYWLQEWNCNFEFVNMDAKILYIQNIPSAQFHFIAIDGNSKGGIFTFNYRVFMRLVVIQALAPFGCSLDIDLWTNKTTFPLSFDSWIVKFALLLWKIQIFEYPKATPLLFQHITCLSEWGVWSQNPTKKRLEELFWKIENKILCPDSCSLITKIALTLICRHGGKIRSERVHERLHLIESNNNIFW